MVICDYCGFTKDGQLHREYCGYEGKTERIGFDNFPVPAADE